MNAKPSDARTPEQRDATASPGWRRTYRRWRMLTWIIAVAFLILPVLFILYLNFGLHQLRR